MNCTSFNQIYSDSTIAQLKIEFPERDNICYLEHAGATLYSTIQISEIFDDLKNNIFANPHSRSTTSKLTEDNIDQVRIQILDHFNTTSNEYTVIFTSGATAAVKLLAESFDFQNDGTFAYLLDNHTSVLGMREFCKKILPIAPDQAFDIFNSNTNQLNGENYASTECGNSLFAFPAQSNFSGTKYDLNWIEQTQDGVLNNVNNCKSNWYCCLDAAAFVSTNYLDLSKYKPDFVCVSFYKIFGYPTGLGALLVKNESASVLKRNYFGGGTVYMALANDRTVVPRENIHERFEDGTLPFLSIISLRHGFATLKRLNLSMDVISTHTFHLAKYTHDQMATLHHNNGKPLCQLYNDGDFEVIRLQGGIINFNLMSSDGSFIGFAQVLHIANLFGIQLRTGCFCNPGACQRFLRLTMDDLKRHFEAGHVCGDQNDLIDGQPTGSVRISFGYMSTKKDADTFLEMITDCFCSKPVITKKRESQRSKLFTESGNIVNEWTRKLNNTITSKSRANIIKSAENVISEHALIDINSNNKKTYQGVLKNIYIYPIKSCAAFEVKNGWILNSKGLQFDREFMIVNNCGVCVTQKQITELCKLKPIVDLRTDKLILQYEEYDEISIPLNFKENRLNRINLCQTKVCMDLVTAWDCGDLVANWINAVLNQSGLRLLRQNHSDTAAVRCTKSNVEVSLANQAQYLLINLSSVAWLRSLIKDDNFHDDLNSMIQRFRANFVVDFGQPFVENNLNDFVTDNGLEFQSDGKCTRCQMICVNQINGERTVEPLKTLSKELSGKLSFGVYLRKCDSEILEIFLNCNVSAK